MQKDKRAPHKWTPETLAAAAATCTTRGEFKENYPGGYNLAIARGLLAAICSHMTSRYQRWTQEALRLEASKYTTRSEFRAGSPNAYAASVRSGQLSELVRLYLLPSTGIGNHLVYRLTFATRVYIGLTCTSDLRNQYHLRRGVVAKHMKATGEPLPETEILADHLTPEEASQREIEEIAEARRQGMPLLNTAAGGQLGAFGRTVWSKDRVLQVAARYRSRTAFKESAPAAFSNARSAGWLEEACQHMPILRRKFTEADIERIAKRFSTRAALQKYEPSVYNAARSRGILGRVCHHMLDGRSDPIS